MSQKSSLPQAAKSVSQVLMSDNLALFLQSSRIDGDQVVGAAILCAMAEVAEEANRIRPGRLHAAHMRIDGLVQSCRPASATV